MIHSHEQLRQLYGPAQERSVKKQLDRLDSHCQKFIELAPFVVISTCDSNNNLDASPKGGSPGFVKFTDDKTVLIPDASGNNRLDSLTNIIDTAQCGLLFLIPGVDETLRINGVAELDDNPNTMAVFGVQKRPIKLVIRVAVRDAYLHCAKAFMRSKLWEESSKIDRSMLPSMGQMLKDQIGDDAQVETREEMLERYKALL